MCPNHGGHSHRRICTPRYTCGHATCNCFFWILGLIYRISLKCHLLSKFSMRERLGKINFSQNRHIGLTLKIGHPYTFLAALSSSRSLVVCWLVRWLVRLTPL